MKVKNKPRNNATESLKPTKPIHNRSLCPINMVLQMVGDSWSLLILRDMMMKGHRSYQAFLNSDEKIATNILADRLVKLENIGLITKGPDVTDARKFIYGLTVKGADLAPLLVEMSLFGAKHAKIIDTPKDVLDAMRRNKTAYTQNLIKAHAPKPRRKPVKIRHEDMEETLNLFDDF